MMRGLKSIADVDDLRGVRVLVRSSLNVPVRDGKVQNEFRLRRALPTLQFLQKAGARTVLVGHIGRKPEETLKPVCDALSKYLPITWHAGVIDEHIKEATDTLHDGDVLMLENLRQDEREKANDASFGQLLASLADIYVNDAFSASHREHASIVGVPQHIPGYAGITFLEECTELQKAEDPQSPSLFILGGAKFQTKMPLIEKYLGIYDKVFIGGALANDVWKARGLEVGRSVVSDMELNNTFEGDEQVLLPVDVTVVDDNERARVTTPDDVQENEIIYDAGPDTIKMMQPLIRDAKAILWNGPFGYFEGGFAEYTKQCAELIARSGAHSIVGGGDTIASIETLGLHDDFGFVSTAGGAMLMFLETGTLPGIEALQK